MISHRESRDPLRVAVAKAYAGKNISVVIDRNHWRWCGGGEERYHQAAKQQAPAAKIDYWIDHCLPAAVGVRET